MLRKVFLIMASFMFIFNLFGCNSINKKDQYLKIADDKNSNKSITLVLADNQSSSYPTTLGDKEFARLVQERTNGRIQINVVTDAQLGAENDVVTQIKWGTIDFARVNIAVLANDNPEINILELPFLFRDAQHMWSVLDGEIGQDILRNLSSAKIVGLAYYDSGARSFYNNKKEIKSISDLKGLRIRVQDSELMKAFVTSLGAVAVPLDSSMLTQALALGNVDGAENNPPIYVSSNQYSIAKYFTIDEHSRIPDILIASETVMSNLSKEDQDIIKKAAKDSVQVQKSEWTKYETNSLNTLKAEGCKITELDAVSREEFISAVESVYDKFGGQYKDIIKRIKDTKYKL